MVIFATIGYISNFVVHLGTLVRFYKASQDMWEFYAVA